MNPALLSATAASLLFVAPAFAAEPASTSAGREPSLPIDQSSQSGIHGAGRGGLEGGLLDSAARRIGDMTDAAIAECEQSLVPEVAHAAKQLRSHDWQAAASTYARVVKTNKYSPVLWHNYGYALHKAARYDEALQAYTQADTLGFGWTSRQEPWMFEISWVWACGRGVPAYNMARVLALQGHSKEALASLERAQREGFNSDYSARTEPDFASLLNDAHFQQLVGIPPDGMTRDQRWCWDLDYLARRMPQAHYNLFAKTSPEKFQEAVSLLKSRVPSLKDVQIAMEIQRLTAMAGDGHTRLAGAGPYSLPDPPIQFFDYADGIYVSRADQRYAALLGCRVLKVGDRPIDETMTAIRPYCSVDGPMGYRLRIPALLGSMNMLETLGLLDKKGSLQLTVEGAEGKPLTTELMGNDPAKSPPQWININNAAKAPLPIYLRHQGDNYCFEHLPESKLVYFLFNSVADKSDKLKSKAADQKTDISTESFPAFCHRLMECIEANHAEYLVIDVRNNGGGDASLNKALLRELFLNEKINRKGHLFVIIGRKTFSAALNLVGDLETRTAAIFVGEPTGSGPNFVGQYCPMTLPCSDLAVSCAAFNWQLSFSSDRRQYFEPDVSAELTSRQAADNVDPALQAILGLLGQATR